MRIQDSVWQGNFGYWQNLFIHQNLLVIGYTAWTGFLTAGRGIVVCHVDIPNTEVDWHIDTVPYSMQFLPELQIADYLRNLGLEPTLDAELLPIVATYDPTQAIVILLAGNGQIDINLLQQMAISPAECCEQVRQRWQEFQSDLTVLRMR